MNELVTRLVNQEVDIVCATGEARYKGRIKACAGGVITLEADGRLTFIAVDKIVSLSQR